MQHSVVGRPARSGQTDACANFGDLASATRTQNMLDLDKLTRACGPYLDVVNKGVGLTCGAPVLRSEVTAAADIVVGGPASFRSLRTAAAIESIVGAVVRLEHAQAVDAVDSTLFGQLAAGALAYASTGVIQLLSGARVPDAERLPLLRFWANTSEHITCWWNSYRLNPALREAGIARGCLYVGPMPDALRRLLGVVDAPPATPMRLLRAVAAEHDQIMAAYNPPPPRPPPARVPAGSKHAIAMVTAAAQLLPSSVNLPLLRPAFTGPVQPYVVPVPGRDNWFEVLEDEADAGGPRQRGRARPRRPSHDAPAQSLGKKRQREVDVAHARIAPAGEGAQPQPAAAADGRRFGLFSGPPRVRPLVPVPLPEVYASVVASLAHRRTCALQEQLMAEAVWASPRGRAVAASACDSMGVDELESWMQGDVRRLQLVSPRLLVAASSLQAEAVPAVNRRMGDDELAAWSRSAPRDSGRPVNLVRLVRIRPALRATHVVAAMRARRQADDTIIAVRQADDTIIAVSGPSCPPLARRTLPPAPSGTIQW